MRIIAGSKRGMNLFSPKTMVSRPITDRVKESLFDVLYNYGLPDGAVVTDLFSGVGSLGLEALSRGAKFVTFVEKNHDIVQILKKNIAKAGFSEKSRVIKGSAFNTELYIAGEGKKCGIIFVDPPYQKSNDTELGSPLADLLISLCDKITDDGIVIVRTSSETSLADNYGCLNVFERRRWGTMNVTIFRSANP